MNKLTYKLVLGFMLIFNTHIIFAKEDMKQGKIQKLKDETVFFEAEKKREIAKQEAKKAKQKTKMIEENFDKFGFGLGFGVILLKNSDITNVIVDSGTVRVIGEEKNKMGFWLTTSWINDEFPTTQIGVGPFFGVQLGGNNDIINSIALGIDFSFKRLGAKLPLDFQIGYAVTRIKVLADGYIENSPPPGAATQVLTKDTTEKGIVFIFSYKL